MNEKIYDIFNEKNVLITGGAGAIGGNLVRKLNELNTKKIIILDDLSSAYEWNVPLSKKILFIKGSILNEEKLKWAFSEKPDIIFHLAAHFANQNSVDNPEIDLMVNGMGILKVLEYTRLIDVERFVYSSSGCGVYGLDSKIPFEEHDISISLHTPYQVTKLIGELYTNYFHNLYGLPIVNARFFNMFGPGEVPGKYRNVIPNFFYWAMSGQPLPITGTGEETRDWTYVDDLVDGLLAMAYYKGAIGEAINLGSEKETRVIDMANMILELTESKACIEYKQRRDWDKKTHLLSSTDKAKKILKFENKVNFQKGLENTYKWFVDNWDNIKKSAEF